MISRRTFIKGAAGMGVAAIAVPEILSAIGNKPKIPGIDPLSITPQPLRIPPVITGGDLNMAPGSFAVFPNAMTNLLMVNNEFPAPTIKLKFGDTFAATIHNNLTVDSVLHWHGVTAPAAMGGHPANVVPAGSSYAVNFPIVQRSCMSFYHAHPHMATGQQVYMGLAGFFLIEDDDELAMGLPSGDYDIPLMIQDKRVDANSQLIYALTQADMQSGWLGDTIMVNGTPNPYLTVAPTLYRFRIVNASNARFYKLALTDGTAFTVIGNDGGFLTSPQKLTSVNLAPAERLDILIDFSSYSQGQTVTLESLAFTMSDPPGSGTVPQGAQMNLLKFQINLTGTSGGNIPTSLPTIVQYNVADIKTTRVWTFSAMRYINNLAYDVNRIDAQVPFGELEKWTFNSVGNTHPVHIHGAQFQVIDRNGSPPDLWEQGWKDVIRLDPQGTVNVLVQFTAYPGLFLIHCHKLEHADEGMMSNFTIDAQSSSVQQSNSSIQIAPNPASDHAVIYFPLLTGEETLTISDERGGLLFSQAMPAGADLLAVSTTPFSDGRYMVEIGALRAALVILKEQ
jgi:FtsP/CotA-like multicopper oxidase with cupredoxin domain